MTNPLYWAVLLVGMSVLLMEQGNDRALYCSLTAMSELKCTIGTNQKCILSSVA